MIADQFTDITSLDQIRSELNALSVFRKADSLEEIVEKFLEEISRVMRFDFLSVYLLNRSGGLSCLGTSPEDYPNWAKLEDWNGLFPTTLQGQKLFEIYHCADPRELPKDPFWDRANTLLGHVSDMTRIPLNGATRTFGFMECVNLGGVRERPGSTRTNVARLAWAGAFLASAITLWRSHEEIAAAHRVTASLVSERARRGITSDLVIPVLEGALAEGLGNLRDYRAFVLRIETPENHLKVVAKAINNDLSWEGWQNRDVHSGRFLAGEVYQRGTWLSVFKIEEHPEKFTNLDWIRACGFRSAICLPLTIAQKVIGTLTAYTGFEYEYTPSDRSVLETLSNAFALFCYPLCAESSELAMLLDRFRDECSSEKLGWLVDQLVECGTAADLQGWIAKNGTQWIEERRPALAAVVEAGLRLSAPGIEVLLQQILSYEDSESLTLSVAAQRVRALPNANSELKGKLWKALKHVIDRWIKLPSKDSDLICALPSLPYVGGRASLPYLFEMIESGSARVANSAALAALYWACGAAADYEPLSKVDATKLYGSLISRLNKESESGADPQRGDVDLRATLVWAIGATAQDEQLSDAAQILAKAFEERRGMEDAAAMRGASLMIQKYKERARSALMDSFGGSKSKAYALFSAAYAEAGYVR